MKKIFLALMCFASATMFAACGNQANNSQATDEQPAQEKSAKAIDTKDILEPIYLSDEGEYTLAGYPVPENVIEEIKAAYGIEDFGRVKGFDIKNAHTFLGEGDRSDISDGFMFEFVPKNGGAYKHDIFDAYAKAIWDKCAKAAEGGELKDSSWDDAKTISFDQSIKVVDKKQDRKKSSWYYIFQGLKCRVEIIERGYTENGFQLLYVHLERIN